MSLSIAEAIYVTLVTCVGGYVFVKMRRLIGSSERQRVGNVRRRRRFDAIETSAPIEDPTSVALRRGVESIEHQFSVVRRLLLPVILLFVGALVAPDADLDLVGRIALRAPLASPHFANHEDPKFWVTAIEKDAIWGWVVAWADSPSATWSLKNDIREQLLTEFARHGIARSLQRHLWKPETKGGEQEAVAPPFEPGAACEAMQVASPPTAAGYA